MSNLNNDTFNEVKEIGIDAYLARQQDKSLLRMLTCGSVDDGKSTLIGKLLYDTNSLYEDQIASIKNLNHGEIDFSLFVEATLGGLAPPDPCIREPRAP